MFFGGKKSGFFNKKIWGCGLKVHQVALKFIIVFITVIYSVATTLLLRPVNILTFTELTLNI